MVEGLRRSWESESAYRAWRELFGPFPDLCPEWWIVR
jgi:hypothetical protein